MTPARSIPQWNYASPLNPRYSILQHPPLFRKATRNWYLFPAIVFSFVIAIFFLYVPAFHEKLSTTQIPVAHWFIPMGFGVGILLIDEARKWALRTSRS